MVLLHRYTIETIAGLFAETFYCRSPEEEANISRGRAVQEHERRIVCRDKFQRQNQISVTARRGTK